MAYVSGRSSLAGREAVWTYGRDYKRLFDIVICILAAPFILPLVAVAALFVILDGHSPFYSQERVGFRGRAFRMWKLRSMKANADALLAEHLASDAEAAEEWRVNQKLKNDPRITLVGKFLRKSSIDELPQLWNVFVGDMSIVGPRPMMVEQRELYTGRAYFKMRPGLTGYWQISDRSQSSFEDRVPHDEKYFADRSFGVDLKVMIRTVLVVLRGTGV